MRLKVNEQQEVLVEGLALSEIAARFGTPTYVYSREALENQVTAFQREIDAEKTLLCYAVKANSNLSLLKLLVNKGLGFDIVSSGELERVLLAGAKAQNIVFSGVGKQWDEIAAALKAGIYCLNVESESELQRIQAVAKSLKVVAPICLRINPNIDAETHPHISTGKSCNKFGIELQALRPMLQSIKDSPHLHLLGLAAHIGSQLTQLEPLLRMRDCLLQLYLDLAADGLYLECINVGGGLGVRYKDETPPTVAAYVKALRQAFDPYPVKLIFEPGRSIMASSGLLLCRVEYLKKTPQKSFAIVDAAMNDLMRPALYQAWHDIIPVQLNPSLPVTTYEVVGPVCESTDILGTERPLRIEAGDLLAILMAGAYGFSMSSNYNSRPRPAEVLIDQGQAYLIRQREKTSDSLALEMSPLIKEPYGL